MTTTIGVAVPDKCKEDPTDDVRTPVTILTGFLGSGKTTLLNRALKSPDMAASAVVINEFGQVPIDHALTATSDDNVFVLENGCLCCTVFGDLLETLNRLYHARAAGDLPVFDRVLIETSGLADPSPVLQAFLSDPTLAGLFRLASVVTTIDAVNGPGTLREHGESVRQLALADRVVITKSDLLPAHDGPGEDGVVALIRRINPAAAIHFAYPSGFDPAKVLCPQLVDPGQGAEQAGRWLNLEAYQPPAGIDPCTDEAHGHDHHHHGHHHYRDDGAAGIATFAMVRETPTSRGALQLLLNGIEQNLGPRLLRVKGFVNVCEEPGRPAIIQGAQHLLHNVEWLDRWPDDDHRTRLVFITYGLPRSELEELVGLLDRVAVRTSQARQRARASHPAG